MFRPQTKMEHNRVLSDTHHQSIIIRLAQSDPVGTFKLQLIKQVGQTIETIEHTITATEVEFNIFGYATAKIKVDALGALYIEGKWPQEFSYDVEVVGACHVDDLYSVGQIRIKAEAIYNHQAIVAKESVQLVAVGEIVNLEQGHIRAEIGCLDIAAASVLSATGRLDANTDVKIAAACMVVSHIACFGHLVIDATALSFVSGSVKTKGNITINAQNIAHTADLIASGNNFTMTAQNARLISQCTATGKMSLSITGDLAYRSNTFLAAKVEIICAEGLSLTMPLDNAAGDLSLIIKPDSTIDLQILAPVRAKGTIRLVTPGKLIIGTSGALQEIIAGGELRFQAGVIDNRWGKIFGQEGVYLQSLAEIFNGTATVVDQTYRLSPSLVALAAELSFVDEFHHPNGAFISSGSAAQFVCTLLQNVHGEIYVAGDLDTSLTPKIVNLSGMISCQGNVNFSQSLIENRTLFDASLVMVYKTAVPLRPYSAGGRMLKARGNLSISQTVSPFLKVRVNQPVSQIAAIQISGNAIFSRLINSAGNIYVAGTVSYEQAVDNPFVTSTFTVYKLSDGLSCPIKTEVRGTLTNPSDIMYLAWSSYLLSTSRPAIIIAQHQGVISAGATLAITSKTLVLLGVVSAPDVIITEFTNAIIGLSDTNIKLPPPKPLQPLHRLIDYDRPSGLYETTAFGESPTVMRLTVRLNPSIESTLPPMAVIYPNGFYGNYKHLRPISPPFKERQLLTEIFMKNLGRGYLDAEHTTSEQIYFKLRWDAHQLRQNYLEENGVYVPNTLALMQRASAQITSALLVYEEINYVGPHGNEMVLSPVVWFPPSYDNAKVRTGAGLIYGNKIAIVGDRENPSLLHITACIEAKDKLVLAATKGLLEKRQHLVQRVVTDIHTSRTLFKRKSRTKTRVVDCRSVEPGGEILAGALAYDFDYLEAKGVKFILGEGGLRGRITDSVTLRPVVDVAYHEKSSGARNLFNSSTSTVNIVHYTPIPTSIFSLAQVIQASENTQTLCAVQVLASGQLVFSARNGLFIEPYVMTEMLAPKHRVHGLSHTVTTGTMQRALATELVSLSDSIELTSCDGTVSTTALKGAGATGINIAGASITNNTLVLQHTQTTRSRGIAGLTFYNAKQREQHQTAMAPELNASGAIRLIATKGDNTQIGLRATTSSVLEITAAQGRVRILEQQLHHCSVSTTYSVGMEFFGSKALESLIKNDFEQAANALVREFPVLAALNDLARVGDVADTVGHSVKTLYHAYQTYKRFAGANHFKTFIEGEVSLSPKLRFSKEKTTRHWTEAALPWLAARQIIIQAKHEARLRGVNAESETIDLRANSISLEAAQVGSSFEHKGGGVTIGLNMFATTPMVGLDATYVIEKANQFLATTINASQQAYLHADGIVNLKGAFINTVEIIIEAEKLYIESLQDRLDRREDTVSMGNTNFAFSHTTHHRRWVAVQSGFHASKQATLNINSGLSIGGRMTTDRGVVHAPKIMQRVLEDVDKGVSIGAAISIGARGKKRKSSPLFGLVSSDYRCHEKGQVNSITGQLQIKDSKHHYGAVVPLGDYKALAGDLSTILGKPLHIADNLIARDLRQQLQQRLAKQLLDPHISNQVKQNMINQALSLVMREPHKISSATRKILKTGITDALIEVLKEVSENRWEKLTEKLGFNYSHHLQKLSNSEIGSQIGIKTYIGSKNLLFTFAINLASASMDSDVSKKDLIKKATSQTASDVSFGLILHFVAGKAAGPISWGLIPFKFIDNYYNQTQIDRLEQQGVSNLFEAQSLYRSGHPMDAWGLERAAADQMGLAARTQAGHHLALIIKGVEHHIESAFDRGFHIHSHSNNQTFFKPNQDEKMIEKQILSESKLNIY